MAHDPLRIGVHGAAGRMGSLVAASVLDQPTLRLAAATERDNHPRMGTDLGLVLGRDACGVLLSSLHARLGEIVDVIVDFSLPQGTDDLLDHVAGVPLVVGTTGLDADQKARLAVYAHDAPVVWAPNFSVGVALLARLAGEVAEILPDYDVEIVEMHHRRKRDAPSGTALRIARAMTTARRQVLESEAVFGRHGDAGPRPAGQIGIHALRGGDVVGEHTVRIAGPGEVLELGHTATTRGAFVSGSLRAAEWVHRQPAGLYTFENVLGWGQVSR